MDIEYIQTTIMSLYWGIRNMNPVKVYMDGCLVWDDENFDISGLPHKQALDAVRKHRGELDRILHRDDLIKSIKYDIVYGHHSIVYIETKR